MTYLKIDVFEEQRRRHAKDDNWGVRATKVPEASIDGEVQIIIDMRVSPEDAAELLRRAFDQLHAGIEEV